MSPTSSAKRSSSCSSGTTSSNAGLANTRATSTKNKSEETFLRRPRNRHEASFNPIRYAREYSVLKTACPAPCSPFDTGSIRETIGSLARGSVTSTSIILTRVRLQFPKQCRTYGGHRRRKRRKPTSDCPRSSQVVAGSCVLGLRTHSKTIFRTIAGLPTWEVLALPRGRNPRLGEMSARRRPCGLTPALE